LPLARSAARYTEIDPKCPKRFTEFVAMDANFGSQSRALPWFCRWLYAPIVIAFTTGAGAFCFCVYNRIEPFGDLDYWFYAYDYCGIGLATGVVTWFLARLIALQQMTFTPLAVVILAAYGFALVLALDKNPAIAIVATAAFGFVMLLAWMSCRAAR
jgi:hypothetical protein